MKQVELSRRNFLKWSAGAVAGIALLELDHPVYRAEAAPANCISFAQMPTDCEQMASESKLIQQNWEKLQGYVGSIHNQSLQQQVRAVLSNPAPTFMEQYGSGDAAGVYNELESCNLVDPQKVTAGQLFPPIADARKTPQPFLTAPGSGYGSHHPYPGGLVTHTAANVSIAVKLYETYQDVFFYACDYDMAIAGEILHDLAKPYVFQWQPDGSSLKEYTIAGTGSHHIFSIAESIYRGIPNDVVVAQACAHNHPGSEKDAEQVAAWLQAACVIAGKDPVRQGLLSSDLHMRFPIRPEGFIVHLADHDWVLSGFAATQCVKYLKDYSTRVFGINSADTAKFNVFRNYVGCQLSFMRLYQAMVAGADNRMADKLIEKLVTK